MRACGGRSRRRRAFLLVLWGLVGFSGPARPTDYPPLFTSEQRAQQHCPGDVVVWIDPTIGVYRLKGQKGYAKTNRGAYACKSDADRTGAHAAEPSGNTGQ
jgi:hypothetical protein